MSGEGSIGTSRLLLELGRGGMGVVYLAVAERRGGFRKLKVIKRLRPDLADDARALAMFLEEARLSARLRHPNIVQTNEVGFDGRYHFLEMEYLDGESYNALLKRAAGAGGLPLALSLWILAQTLAGLEHAHTAKDLDGTPLSIVHRDVSPHNVLITHDGAVKVLDFGIAKAADSTADTQTGMLKGKVAYMAPEQIARENVDRRADIFAVGVMLWQALAGKRMWGDQGDFEIFLRVREGDIPRIADAAPAAPPELVAICERALAVKAADRWGSAAEMQAAIEAYLTKTGESVGDRVLAARMRELFGEDRAKREAEIEVQIRATADRALSDVQIPRVGDAPEVTPMARADTPPPPPRARSRRATTLAVAAALVAGLAVAVAIVRVRAARERASTPPACVSNAACTKSAGRPSLCRATKCVALETEECKLLAEPGDVANESTIWLGSMLPLTGPQAALGGLASMRALDLARRDFVQITRGIPSTRPDVPPRPLAVVSCDDSKNPAAVARHLVDDVRVPAVIGFASSQEVIDLSTQIFLPRRVLVAAALNMSALITSIPHPTGEPRLVWRTTLSSADITVPVGRLISDFAEPRARAAAHLTADDQIRIALVRHPGAAGLSFADALVTNVHFNGGKSVVANGARFREFVLSEAAEADAGGPDEALVDALVTFRPNVILAVGQGELTATVFAPVEARWPRGHVVRPIWISPNAFQGDEFFAFLGTDVDRRHRFLGVGPLASTVPNLKFTNRYNETFADKVSLNLSPAGSYDALYLLAYAAYAGGDAELSGPSLAGGIARLVPPGRPVDVGPTRIYEALEALRKGENIDLGGAGNRLDFDVKNGEAPGDYAVLCVGLDANGRASDSLESGLTYDAASKSLKGTLACP